MRSTLQRFIVLAAIVFSTFGGAVASAQPPRGRSPQLRWGVEAGGGGAWGTPRGPAIGAFGQIGLQFDRRFALFYQPSLLAHALGTSDDADVFLAFGNLAMADVTIDILQLGLGGGFDVGRFAECTNSECVSGERSLHPAIGGRIAILLPLHTYRRRLAIPFAFHVHSTFLDGDQRLTALMFTIGVERY